MLGNSKFSNFLLYLLTIVLATIVLVGVITVSAQQLENSKGIKVPIIMYHSVLKDDSRSNDYIISTATLEKDLIYLIDNGYTTIFISDLVNYVYKDIPLPEKPIVLTFDDGNLNNLTYVLPLLQKYDMKANISIVGDYTDKFSQIEDSNPAYCYLKWDDISELVKSGNIEIGNHSNKMHTADYKRMGSRKNKNESYEDYLNKFICDTSTVQDKLKKNCGITPEYYAYPYGFYCKESEEILKNMGFKSTLICNERMNFITKSPECLYLLNRYNRPSGISTKDFMKKVLN